jgi:hypothetical protein
MPYQTTKEKEGHLMAEILDRFPTNTGIARYPWDEWLDGRVRKFQAGVDFKSQPATFRSNAHAQGRRRGGRTKTVHLVKEVPEAVVLQFIPN